MSNYGPTSAELPKPTLHASVADMPNDLRTLYRDGNLALTTLYEGVLGRRHLERSNGAIFRSAQAGLDSSKKGPTRALILGAGQLADTPFLNIVRDFDHTTFVEPDIHTTETALRTLPPKLLGKVSLVGADVTGVAALFANTMDALTDEKDDYPKFAESAARAVQDIQTKHAQPDLGKPFNFVCSHLVLSQLTEPLQEFLNGRLSKPPYKTRLSSPDKTEAIDQPLASAISVLRHELQKQHISYLRRLVANSGVVHFADIYTRLRGRGKDFRRRAVLNERMLDLTIAKDFVDLDDLRKKERWFWAQPVQSSIVISRALIPKLA